jgi:CHASE2 domain-containing sensor protein/signal transduction histidine kinase
VRRRFFAEWLLMALVLPPALVWLQRSPSLVQADLTLYDWAMSARQPEPSLDVLIVGIDERSLKTLGPWPWSRSVHARLLEQLAPHEPVAVLLDLFLDQASPVAEDDRLLAEALAKVPAYLPLRYVAAEDGLPGEAGGFREPLGMFARNVRATGHAVMTTDADGVARRMFMFEGSPGAVQAYVGIKVAGSLRGSSVAGPRQLPGAGPQSRGVKANGRHDAFGVPFAGRAGTWRTVPYISVLKGEVPPELLRGKLVLVGAIASSNLGEGVPVAGAGPMTQLSGIEVHANAIDALRNGRAVSFAGGPLLVLWISVPVLLALVLFLWVARSGWAVAVILAASCLALCLVVLSRQHLWLPPTAPLLGIALAYFLWSWRRLDALFAFFGARVAALNAVPASVFEPERRVSRTAWDSVEAQTLALDGAIDRLSQMQALLAKGFRQLPVALLVCTEDGTITQSNVAARSLLVPDVPGGGSRKDPLNGRPVLSVLSQCEGREPQVASSAAVHWSVDVDREYTTVHGQVFRARAAPLTDVRGATTSWMVVLRDLTSERRAERDRQQWLSFMSHDMRTPQINILGLLDLHADGAHGMDARQLVQNVRREAERSLALADGLVDLMQARLHTYRFAEVPAGAVVLDAMDQVWAHARSRGIVLSSRLEAEDAMLWADTALLTRAIVNLLRNAIRHSAAGRAIELHVSADAEPGRVRVAVRDEGEGMDPGQMQELLRPGQSGRAENPGARSSGPAGSGGDEGDSRAHAVGRSHGIGLAIVRAVAERHGGMLEGFSVPGAGTTFVLNLPLYLPVDGETETS